MPWQHKICKSTTSRHSTTELTNILVSHMHHHLMSSIMSIVFIVATRRMSTRNIIPGIRPVIKVTSHPVQLSFFRPACRAARHGEREECILGLLFEVGIVERAIDLLAQKRTAPRGRRVGSRKCVEGPSKEFLDGSGEILDGRGRCGCCQ